MDEYKTFFNTWKHDKRSYVCFNPITSIKKVFQHLSKVTKLAIHKINRLVWKDYIDINYLFWRSNWGYLTFNGLNWQFLAHKNSVQLCLIIIQIYKFKLLVYKYIIILYKIYVKYFIDIHHFYFEYNNNITIHQIIFF